jgi:hypothetical protein
VTCRQTRAHRETTNEYSTEKKNNFTERRRKFPILIYEKDVVGE